MKKKILIVEDEEILREMYKEKLSEDFEVVLAESASKGLEAAKKEKPDLILLDVLMPQENGVSFLEKLRKGPETKDLKVVAFSNYDDPRTREEIEKFNIEDYLIKTNFTPTEIAKKIKEYL